MFVPKLFKILKAGGQGNAAVVYRNLLPLLSHFPAELNNITFYSNYFENLRSGYVYLAKRHIFYINKFV